MPLALVSPRPAALTLVQAAAVLLLAASLGACGSSGSKNVAQRGSYKVGAPYKIDGVTYTPQEEFNHVETGVASWYGPGFHGKSTANGEPYDQSARTAAHRTLQMPAIVRVTNLDNGMSTVVRINDRGPFARSRIIDLSRTAAQELDIVRNGTGHVRIEQLQAESLAVKDVAIAGGGPAEQQAAVAQASSGRYAPVQAQAPVQTAAYAPPPPAPAPAYTQPAYTQPAYSQPAPTQPVWPTNPRSPAADPAPAYIPASSGGATVASLATGSTLQPASGFYVQTGAFATPENAERQRGAVSSYGASEISQGSAGGRDVYRVRLGPYTTSDAAGIVADRLKRSGYGDARVVAN
jgi:rare lipoprotein A